ncbi:putative oligouridylate-binding protein 1B [Iris pallida]|uniref:Oligouridylate-binding protein 1B n=1 Tax=Iris pallida TaxID=29817 RepID=A0AAX6EMC4_IRIPA|nr:putative oligouridylate-binding protein 1B [Iris pallida]
MLGFCGKPAKCSFGKQVHSTGDNLLLLHPHLPPLLLFPPLSANDLLAYELTLALSKMGAMGDGASQHPHKF